ncbi:UNVERIFIED_CONTAM: hypothetical protein GTU68_014237, partial [Idotea baltica]|nr:hypothetical protein [Idotea baltica]
LTLDKANPVNTLFGADISQLVFEAVIHESYHLQIKIYDPANSRYEVPIPIRNPDDPETSSLFTVAVSGEGEPLAFSVSRNSTGTVLFNVEGPLTFEDQFIQFTTRLTSDYLYGIGEHSKTSLKHSFDERRTYPIFARDQPDIPDAQVNQYGSHPYYVNVEDDDGNTHSVLMYNSNAMEYSTFAMSDGLPAVTIRTIGGIIDLHFFLGPTPEDVNLQYAGATGERSFPPYWSFGFQLSRWGYDSTENYRVVYDRMKAAGIPWDTQVFDIDYMDRYRDFTYDPDNWADLPALIDELHDANMRVVLILDPALVTDWDNYEPSQRGRDSDVFIKWQSSDLVPEDQVEGAGDYVVGYVWPDTKTVFPDFFKPETVAWWDNELLRLKQSLDYDGIWIDMNEPSNFGTNLDKPFNWPAGEPDWSLKCPENSLDSPPYPTLAATSPYSESQRLSDKTICMSTTQTDGITNLSPNHYDVHNLYGLTESLATYTALFETIFPKRDT